MNPFLDAHVFISVESHPPGHTAEEALGERCETVTNSIISCWQMPWVFLSSSILRRKASKELVKLCINQAINQSSNNQSINHQQMPCESSEFPILISRIRWIPMLSWTETVIDTKPSFSQWALCSESTWHYTLYWSHEVCGQAEQPGLNLSLKATLMLGLSTRPQMLSSQGMCSTLQLTDTFSLPTVPWKPS